MIEAPTCSNCGAPYHLKQVKNMVPDPVLKEYVGSPPYKMVWVHGDTLRKDTSKCVAELPEEAGIEA